VRLWLAGSLLLTLLLLVPNWTWMPAPVVTAVVLFPYLVFPWFLVVIVLSIEPVAGGRVEALIDGILSRPVTRYEYLLASWMARVLVVLGGYLTVVVPVLLLICFARRSAPAGMITLWGVLISLGLVGLVLVFQVSLGVCVGTIVRRPLLSVLLLLFVWGPVNAILDHFSLEQFSPISLDRALPTLLRRPWQPGAEEGPQAPNLSELARQTTDMLNMFAGPTERKPEPRRGFFERKNFDDVALWEVFLGYGIPTLVCLGLAMFVFSYRDL